jgi:hypothetical protein
MPTVAIDGKASGTLRWHDLCRVLDLDPAKATVAQVRALLSKQYPQAQLCEPQQGLPYALLRMHTVTLISSAAAPYVHLRPACICARLLATPTKSARCQRCSTSSRQPTAAPASLDG